ncbi:MAG: oxidoreductase, partial [Candidatus Omnitrophica bacterium]|nr:oxidoreductase [Candidatus Omnitrophota bacterium]
MKIKARFVEKKTEVLNVNTFTFKPLEPFVYKAGQYAVFDLGKDGKPFAKPFSFIDAPGGENIRITTRMSGSNYKNALDALKPGDEVG